MGLSAVAQAKEFPRALRAPASCCVLCQFTVPCVCVWPLLSCVYGLCCRVCAHQRLVEELRARCHRDEEAAAARLQQAVNAERSSYHDHLAKFDAELAAGRLEVERVRANSSAAASHWESILEEERRRRDNSVSSYEATLVALRRELADARLQHERAALSFEESRGALQR